MYKLGDIIVTDKIKFRDGTYDNKKNRPCMVLFSYEDYVFCLPCTSQTKSFNKNPNDYFIIPTIIFSEKKLSFLKLNNLLKINNKIVRDTGLSVGLTEQNIRLLRKRISNFSEKGFEEYILLEKIFELDDKLKKQQAKDRKLEKKLKRKEAKMCKNNKN